MSGVSLTTQQGVDVEEDSWVRESKKLSPAILQTSHWGLKEQYPRKANYWSVTAPFLRLGHQK